jgi:TPR repeat protein
MSVRSGKFLLCILTGCFCSLSWAQESTTLAQRPAIEQTKAKALAGDVDAQFQMAVYYMQGVPGIMERDQAEGGRWLSFAAEHGSKKARVIIAANVLAHNSPEEARQQALTWLNEGRAQHDTMSILLLASVYEQGTGVRADADTALTILKENATLPEIANELGEVYFRGRLGQAVDYALAMQHFQAAAAKGLPEGIKNVGKLYYLGRGTPKDCAKAYLYLKKAADLNNLHAIYDMGLLYGEGCGVPQDYAQAVIWFQKASDRGHLTAREALAAAYADGRGVAKDERRALELYQSLGENGSPEALHRLAMINEHGIGVEKNPTLAFQQQLQAVRQGSIKALVGLAYYYRDGRGTAPDIQAALDCLKKAALAGDAEAKYAIGNIYDRGKWVKRDPAMAAKWYADSIREDSAALKSRPSVPGAEKIFVDGFGALGRLYYRGDGVPKDIPKAIELIRKGAEGGSVGAMAVLGGFYENGTDLPRDINLALQWYGRAADKGDVDSMFHLGTYHMTISKDYEKAIENFVRAGEKGHAEALFRLGYMQAHGWGCPTDLKMARQSYAKADALGFSHSQQREVLKQRGE